MHMHVYYMSLIWWLQQEKGNLLLFALNEAISVANNEGFHLGGEAFDSPSPNLAPSGKCG